MKRISVVLLLFCAAALYMPQYAQAQVPETFRQEGIASWYGPEFDGRPTASGEIFNSSLLTAAHPTLPFGTMLRVTNRHNNKQVTVRVTDRGPFVSARIIDVSKAAAEQLDMIITGTAPVLIESLERVVTANPGRTAPDAAPDAYWTLPPVPGVPAPVVPAPAPAATAPPAPAAPAAVPAMPAPVSPPPPVMPQAPVYSQPPAAPVPPPQAVPQAQAPAPVYSQPPAAPVSPPPQVVPPQAPAPVYNQPPAAYPQQQVQPIIIYATPPAPAPAAPVQTMPAPAATAPIAAPAPTAAPAAPMVQAPARVIMNAAPGKTYRIQVGAYKMPKNAVDAFEKLKNAGLNPAYERSGEYFRVVLAGVPETEVQLVTEKLGLVGFGEVFVREER